MALFSLSVKSLNRKSGKSAVAAAAYRSCTMLHDDRTGETYDFRRKKSVTSDTDSFIVTPDNAPEWAKNRSALWNAAEAAENRGNSTTGREWLVALPAELDEETRRDLARQFATALTEKFGVAADVSIHAPSKDGDDRNHHAHILTTSRKIDASGLGAKTRELDVKTSASKLTEDMRKAWSEMVNSALEANGKEERVDHRSYERQGIDKSPGIHLGPKATVAKRAGLSHPRLDRIEAIEAANHAKQIRTAMDTPPRIPAPVSLRYRATAVARARQQREQTPALIPAPVEIKRDVSRPRATATTIPKLSENPMLKMAAQRYAQRHVATTTPEQAPAPQHIPSSSPPTPIQPTEPPAPSYSAEAFRADNGLDEKWDGISFPLTHRDRNGLHRRPGSDNLATELEEKKIPHTTKNGWVTLAIEALVDLGKEAGRLMLDRVRQLRRDHQVRLRRENDRGMG